MLTHDVNPRVLMEIPGSRSQIGVTLKTDSGHSHVSTMASRDATACLGSLGEPDSR